MTLPDWAWTLTAGLAVCLSGIVGVVLTALTLPGIWFSLLCAALAQWWSISHSGAANPMFSWWTLGVCFALGVIAELVEIAASAFGAAKAGGTRKGAIASVIGGLLGAIIGSLILPLVGTILGAALGAGLAALLVERHGSDMSWAQSGKVGAGAAAGRLAATLAKIAFAIVIAIILGVAAFI